jgi:cytochrome c oxidase assembly factor CtaG
VSNASSLILIGGDLPPPLDWQRLGATHIDFVSVLLVVAGVLYGVGVGRMGRANPEQPWSTRRTISFVGGLVVTFLAVESVIGVYDDVLFYDHMIQHLMLIMIAAPLFAMGAPVELVQRATAGRTNQVVEWGLGSKIAEVVAHPIVDFGLYAVLIPVAHLTSLYNIALTHQAADDAEHLMFLIIGYLFWRHVVAIEPSRHPLTPPVRLIYLALAVPVDTFTGLTLASTTFEMFPAYLHMHRTWGPSPVLDLHVGGAIMWVGGDSLMLLAMIPCAIQWLRYEEREAAEIDRQLDLVAARARAESPQPPGPAPGSASGDQTDVP